MRYSTIPGIDKKASIICLGTAEFCGTTPESVSRDVMDAYFQGGGNFIDTARVYGDFANRIQGKSEECIGRWMQDRGNREQIVLATKGGCSDITKPAPPPKRMDKASLTDDLMRSLDALKTDYIDLYWLHRDDPFRPVGEILETLNEFMEKGYVKTVGASNWTARRLWAADRYARTNGLKTFSGDEMRWGLVKQLHQIDYECEEMNEALYLHHVQTQLPCIPYASQGKGLFNKIAAGGVESIPEKSYTRNHLGEETLKLYDICKPIAEKLGCSMGVLQLGYLTAQPFPVFPIVTASKVFQLEDALAAGDFVLPQEDMETLREISRKMFGTA